MHLISWQFLSCQIDYEILKNLKNGVLGMRFHIKADKRYTKVLQHIYFFLACNKNQFDCETEGMTRDEREVALQKLNSIRRRLAEGYLHRSDSGADPQAAANMKPLVSWKSQKKFFFLFLQQKILKAKL